jgi:hypothetical protein
VVNHVDQLNRHVFNYTGKAKVVEAFGHLRTQTAFTLMSDIGDFSATDIQGVADWYDLAGVATAVTGTLHVAHRIGVFAGSEELVWLRGQKTYTTQVLAVNGWESETFVYAPWARDRKQFVEIAVIVLRNGCRNFSTAGQCKIIPLAGAAAGGGGSGTIVADQISDASTDGKAWLTAADFAAQRLLLRAVLPVATAGGTTASVASDDTVVFTGVLAQIYTLPAAGAAMIGRIIRIKDLSTGAITITPAGADTIDTGAGGASIVLTTGQSVDIQCVSATGWGIF